MNLRMILITNYRQGWGRSVITNRRWHLEQSFFSVYLIVWVAWHSSTNHKHKQLTLNCHHLQFTSTCWTSAGCRSCIWSLIASEQWYPSHPRFSSKQAITIHFVAMKAVIYFVKCFNLWVRHSWFDFRWRDWGRICIIAGGINSRRTPILVTALVQIIDFSL